jgi:hypothetical protein
MRESSIEHRLKRTVEKLGGLALKWISPGCTGVPDRIVLLPGGRVYFVELKAPGGRLSARQIYIQAELSRLGFKTATLASPAAVDAFCSEVADGV